MQEPLVEEDEIRLDDLDLSIINELLDDPEVSSTAIGKEYGKPLSTIQRRRTRLERTILKKDYGINTRYAKFRRGEIFLRVSSGLTVEVAKKAFEKYDKNITLASTTMNNVGNLIMHIYYRSSPQMFAIIEELKRIPSVDEVLYAEHIEVVGERKPRFILEDLRKAQRSD